MSTRPEAERALIRAGSAHSAEEAQAFFAQRVSDYARILAFVFGGLYLAGIVVTLALYPEHFWAVHLHPAKIANLGFALLSLLLWQIARRPDCPTWLATAGDLALPVSVTLTAALVASTVTLGHGIHFMPLLIAALVLVLRAALVPSPAERTVLVGIATSLPVVYATRVLAAADADPENPFTPAVATFGAVAWCAALIASTALVSRVIYGLHREIANVRRLGQYVLGELIGEGGMGVVYRAQHAMLRRPTAVKLLLPERAGRESIQRFEREVQLTARLTHPNTVAIYDYGRTPEGVFYYAMEYLDGLSLEDLVRRFGPQPEARVVHILLQAAGALAEAHALGLIHRDVKPANILFCERGGAPDAVKVVDFGLVKDLEPATGPELTSTDALTGTPQYLAPESISTPGSSDRRVDIYALGGVGYFLLAGRPPFEGNSVVEICGHHLHTKPAPPSERLGAPVDPGLEALILRCLAKKPDERPRDAQELCDLLLECARRLPWTLAEGRKWWREFRQSVAPPPGRPSDPTLERRPTDSI